MTKLYELTEGMLELQNASDIPEEAIRDTLEAMAGEFNDKGVAIVKVCTNVEGDIEAIDAEIKRLQARKKSKQNFIERLRDYLRTNMEQTGINKIEHSLFSITLGKPSQVVEIDDGAALDNQYIVTTARWDKANIAKDLKAGKIIPGARLVDGKSRLIIK